MAHAGTAHRYSERLVAFEHASPYDSSTTDAPNTILWVGGLTDGLLTVPYPASIAASLPSSWVLAEVLISSSYKGWGTSSLARDARELGDCVKYFKTLRPNKKVVLMGHSTGCQDAMEYVIGKDADNRPGLDGVILQGGVSDREAWEDSMKAGPERDAYDALIQEAKGMVDRGLGKEVMQREGNTIVQEIGGPINAYRTFSILAKGGDDDYFSSDLSDVFFASTFGKFPKSTPVCFLLGAEDPYIPATVDRVALVQRWTKIIREGGGVVDDADGGIVPGAHHNLDGDPEEVVLDLVKRVCGFLAGVEKGTEWSTSGARL